MRLLASEASSVSRLGIGGDLPDMSSGVFEDSVVDAQHHDI